MKSEEEQRKDVEHWISATQKNPQLLEHFFEFCAERDYFDEYADIQHQRDAEVMSAWRSEKNRLEAQGSSTAADDAWERVNR